MMVTLRMQTDDVSILKDPQWHLTMLMLYKFVFVLTVVSTVRETAEECNILKGSCQDILMTTLKIHRVSAVLSYNFRHEI